MATYTMVGEVAAAGDMAAAHEKFEAAIVAWDAKRTWLHPIPFGCWTSIPSKNVDELEWDVLHAPTVSPDVVRELSRRSGAESELWVYASGRGVLIRLVPLTSGSVDWEWSPTDPEAVEWEVASTGPRRDRVGVSPVEKWQVDAVSGAADLLLAYVEALGTPQEKAAYRNTRCRSSREETPLEMLQRTRGWDRDAILAAARAAAVAHAGTEKGRHAQWVVNLDCFASNPEHFASQYVRLLTM